jgi:ubiquitin-like protein ATG12
MSQSEQSASSKVIILFRPVGDAPILKQPKVKVDQSERFSKVVGFLRKQLGRDQVFVYLKDAFSPSLDEKIHILFEAHSVDNKLVVSYACTPAWG